ncbi:MAG: cell division protein ZapA [Defluviitaleaceae bacterium]|nr:cell division protein ZapA [Defluviitaleaceae bacterium]
MENKVNVVINGEITTVVSTEPVEYVQRLGHYVSKKVEEVAMRYDKVMISERQRTLLVSLNIADEYMKVEPELKRLTIENEALKKENVQVSDENIKLTELVKGLRQELAKLRDGVEDKVVALPVLPVRKALK